MSEAITHPEITPVGPRDVDTAFGEGDRPFLVARSFGLTDVGAVRPTNQDNFLIAELVKALQVLQTSLEPAPQRRSGDRSYLFVVADGMGGHAGGERASAVAVDAVTAFVLHTFRWFRQLRGGDGDRVLADFRSALGQANARLLGDAAADPELHGMGTTLTLAYTLNDELFVAHVGDTRCYVSGTGGLYRVTSDHTLVEEMVARKLLTPEQAATHRLRHVITNALGGEADGVRVEVHRLRLAPGDVVLLCSDGLTGMVDEDEIARVLREETDPETACRRLVARANEQGGRDNITAVVARFEAA